MALQHENLGLCNFIPVLNLKLVPAENLNYNL